jgi:hypothetical protein
MPDGWSLGIVLYQQFCIHLVHDLEKPWLTPPGASISFVWRFLFTFLWLTIATIGIDGDSNSMGLYTVDDHQILAHFQDCRTPFGPIPPVGELCRLPQLQNLVIEPLNP